MFDIKFYFRISEEVKMAVDIDGNYGEVYSKCTLTAEKIPTDEQYKLLEERYREAIAAQLGADIKYIVPVSEKEYIENVDEEDEVE